MIDYSTYLKFTSCHVKVTAENGRIHLSAGATMTPEQALELIESLLAARRVVTALDADGPDASDG